MTSRFTKLAINRFSYGQKQRLRMSYFSYECLAAFDWLRTAFAFDRTRYF